MVFVIEASARQGIFALDFQHSSLPAGRLVLHGNFAYNPDFRGVDPFVYPPLTAVLLAPFSALPVWAADALFTAVAIVAAVFALRAFGVDDWRCYGAAFLWPPVLAAVQAGNLSLLLLGGIGLAWVLRTRPFALGLTLALVISSKLFLAPVALWLLVTRRFRAAAWASVMFAALNVAAWFAIGAGSLSAYVDIVQRHTRAEAPDAYTLKVICTRLGLPASVGAAVTAIAAAAVVYAWWRWHRRDDDATLSMTLLVSLIVSPIVWLHYLSLLLAPVAMKHRTLSWLWLVPLVTFVCPGRGSGTLLQGIVGVALIFVVAAATLWPAGKGWRLVPRAGETSVGLDGAA